MHTTHNSFSIIYIIIYIIMLSNIHRYKMSYKNVRFNDKQI